MAIVSFKLSVENNILVFHSSRVRTVFAAGANGFCVDCQAVDDVVARQVLTDCIHPGLPFCEYKLGFVV